MRRQLRRRYLQTDGRRGMALAVAMLVVVMLSGIGAIALSAATYDVSSAGAVRQAADAESVAESGLALTRCEMCESIDAIVVRMQSMRHEQGQAPAFRLNENELQAGLPSGTSIFAPPSATEGRGSFGHIYDTAFTPVPPTIRVTIDRVRETAPIAGYSMRESGGSDTASLCFRYYRVTSRGSYVPFTAGSGANAAEQRAYMAAGPLECSM